MSTGQNEPGRRAQRVAKVAAAKDGYDKWPGNEHGCVCCRIVSQKVEGGVEHCVRQQILRLHLLAMAIH